MIKQIVFDMGGVLMNFDQEGILNALKLEDGDKELFRRQIFRHPAWQRYDRTGNLSGHRQGAKERVGERLAGKVDELFQIWTDYVVPKPEMAALVEELLGLNIPLYILSNAPTQFKDFQENIPGWGRFQGVMLSWEEKLLKADPEIFRRFFTRFGLRPSECFFIDDLNTNIEAADWCGMGTYWYQNDIDGLRAALRGAGILVHLPKGKE